MTKLTKPLTKNKMIVDVTRSQFETILKKRFERYNLDVQMTNIDRSKHSTLETGKFTYLLHRVVVAYYYNHRNYGTRKYGIILQDAVNKYNFATGSTHAITNEE
jgi:hypothetical protein